MNELALKMRGDQPKNEEKAIPIARSRQLVNPADVEIRNLRQQGLEIPRELLSKKHAFNKARHEKDVKRWNELLVANLDL